MRRGYEAWNRGDVGACWSWSIPTSNGGPGADAPEAGENRGRDGFRGFIESWLESFEDLSIVPEELLVEGDCVVAMVRQRGRGRGSGVEVDVLTAHVWRIRDGRAVGWYAYRNRERRTGRGCGRDPQRGRPLRIRGVQRGRHRGLADDPRSGDRVAHVHRARARAAAPITGTTACASCGPTPSASSGTSRTSPRSCSSPATGSSRSSAWRESARRAASRSQARIAHVYTFRDGKVIRVESFEDRDEALRVAGIEAEQA